MPAATTARVARIRDMALSDVAALARQELHRHAGRDPPKDDVDGHHEHHGVDAGIRNGGKPVGDVGRSQCRPREGDEAGTTETALISEMMKHFGLVVQEETITEGAADAEAEQTVAEADSKNEDEDDDNILSPSKPSHVEFGKSTVKEKDLVLMKKLGYFEENDDELVRFAREETIPEPKEDEVVVFKSFFRAGLRFPFMR